MISSKDFTTALYALSKAKGYAVTVVLTLGLTLGTLVAMFNLNFQILAAPLPYPEEARLIAATAAWLKPDGSINRPVATPKVITQIYQQSSDKLSDQALYGNSDFATLRDLPHSPSIPLVYTTPGYMRMYQMPLLHGRAFSRDEDIGSQQPVAVISERLWRSQYNADPALLGQKIQIGQIAFTVVGIAAADFAEPKLFGPDTVHDLWLPWDFNGGFQLLSPSGLSRNLYYLAQLKDANDRLAFEQEVRPQLDALFQQARSAANQGGPKFSVRFHATPLRQVLEGDSRQATLWMLAGSLVLLLIASANITNLILSRAARQQRTMTIQAALGAQRHHLLANVFAELCVLMTAALLLAFAIAQLAYVLLQWYATTTLPRLQELGFNLPTMLFAMAISLLLTLGFAQLISRQLNYRVLQQNLQSSGKGTGVQISSRIRQLLISAQVMLAAMLLVCACQVLSQSLAQLRQHIGFATADRYQVLLEDIAANPANVSSGDRAAQERQRGAELLQIRDLLLQHPAIADASLSTNAPVGFNGVSAGFAAYQREANQQQTRLETRETRTDQHYLPMFDMPLLQGRNFTAQEVASQTPVLIINQALAEQLSPDGKVLGQRLYGSGNNQAFEIIGVTANRFLPAASGVDELPYRSYSPRAADNLLLQLKPGRQIDKKALNALLQQVSPQLRTLDIYSIEHNANQVLLRSSLAAAITTSLVLISFVLATIGTYGVLSYSVQLRRFELGVRMAIGARPGTILRQLLGENLKPVLVGLVLAALALAALWFGLQQTTFIIELSASGFALPLLLIVLLTTLTSLLSVWDIIRKPAIYALQGH
jgi:predicted permease